MKTDLIWIMDIIQQAHIYTYAIFCIACTFLLIRNCSLLKEKKSCKRPVLDSEITSLTLARVDCFNLLLVSRHIQRSREKRCRNAACSAPGLDFSLIFVLLSLSYEGHSSINRTYCFAHIRTNDPYFSALSFSNIRTVMGQSHRRAGEPDSRGSGAAHSFWVGMHFCSAALFRHIRGMIAAPLWNDQLPYSFI